ncbi:MAG: hypothetical protein PUF72_00295 [Clostridiales bacterium]|nr:hypothetical protein [Clostridiales bacterium]
MEKNKKNFLPELLGILSACAVVIVLVVFNIDLIMMRFAPKIYVSSMLAKTVKEIEGEQETVSSVYPRYRSIRDSNTTHINLSAGDKTADITALYNKTTPQLYASGTYDKIAFEGYIQEQETGICLPELMDVYFTLPTENFGEAYNNSLASRVLPFRVSDKMSLSLDILKESTGVDTHELYLCISNMLNEASLKKGSEKGEVLLSVNSQSFKNGMKEIVRLVKSSQSDGGGSALIKKLWGIDIDSSVLDTLLEEIDTLNTDETVTISMLQRNSHIVKIHTRINFTDGGGTDILIDGSKSARLLDNYSASFDYETKSAKLNLEYSCEGNRFHAQEPLFANEKLKITLADIKVLELSRNETGSEEERSGEISVKSEILGNSDAEIEYTASITPQKDTINVSRFALNGTEKGSAVIEISDYTDIEVPKKEAYPLDKLDMSDFAELGKALIFQGG